MDEACRPVPRDRLEEAIEQALWKARKRLPVGVAPGHFNPYRAAAGAVVEHRGLCGITCWRKPPSPLHGSPRGAADGTEDDHEAATECPPLRSFLVTLELLSAR